MTALILLPTADSLMSCCVRLVGPSRLSWTLYPVAARSQRWLGQSSLILALFRILRVYERVSELPSETT